MINKERDGHNNNTLELVNKFIVSNQRKRINLLTDICLLYTSDAADE